MNAFALLRRGLLCLLLALGMQAAHSDEPLRLGIMPFNSALALVKVHQPLRVHLEAALGQPVEVFTEPDYPGFLRESLAGRYDLLITGPHFAVLSAQSGYVPLVHYAASLQPVFVVRAGGGLERPEQLAGRTLALSSRFSISSIAGMKWLADRGMQAERDYRVVEYATHGAAVAAVAVGDADAALTTHTPLHQVPEDVRARVAVVPSDVHITHLMTLAHSRLGAPRVEAVRRALERFAVSPEGRAFFESTGYKGYEPVRQRDLDVLEPYVSFVRQEMGL